MKYICHPLTYWFKAEFWGETHLSLNSVCVILSNLASLSCFPLSPSRTIFRVCGKSDGGECVLKAQKLSSSVKSEQPFRISPLLPVPFREKSQERTRPSPEVPSSSFSGTQLLHSFIHWLFPKCCFGPGEAPFWLWSEDSVL